MQYIVLCRLNNIGNRISLNLSESSMYAKTTYEKCDWQSWTYCNIFAGSCIIFYIKLQNLKQHHDPVLSLNYESDLKF